MKRHRKPMIFSFTLFIFLSAFIFAKPEQTSAFSDQVIQQGAVGDDVIELQARLKHIGFYNGKIDGVFGWGTYWALRNFQYEFGMEIDGLAGQAAKDKLTQATEFDKEKVKQEMYGTGSAPSGGNNGGEESTPTSSVNVPQGYSNNDIQLMANAVYGEARGEPYEGQVAVAAVILNRVNSELFPDTVSGVIFEPRAFTAVADGQIWLEPNDQAREAVLDAINGWDPSGNALYYFNPDTATSGWIWTRPQIKTIGKHIFCS
ncbi:spore cortex-lytic enzyme [Oceanobacillus oncorhynchi subsp. incaldanensis]|uniref:Spore cortex-lytic enzyme n=2 Tax=Bacillaceae TaxID=186817 RepID=A0A0A1MKZ8_9BACI|nr:spore cortex-lytic enzyme [Oceanobacillus oncorhynchi subsp. incaldanensis]CEI83768.1 Spore cortex-lytic enzyme precursor [Oceanobacillus oncorhynchi]